MNMSMRLILLVVMLSVIVTIQTDGVDALFRGKFWRRCKPVHCKWKPWSNWSKCGQTCGGAGVQSRRRAIGTKASCGGNPCKGYQHQERACNRYCLNQGHLYNGHCACSKKFHGPCCQWRNNGGFRGREISAKDDVLKELGRHN